MPVMMRNDDQVSTTAWWAAIRSTDGIRWIDPDTFGADEYEAREKANARDDKRGKEWAALNCIVGIRRLSISTINPFKG
jgi:hypothetical protein